MDPRSILYVSYYNLVFVLVQIQLTLGLVIFIGEYPPPSLDIFVIIFGFAPTILGSIYILFKTPRNIGERYWVKASSEEEIIDKNTLLLNSQYESEQKDSKNQKMLIIRSSRKWDISFITIFSLLFYPTIILISVFFRISFWFAFTISFAWFLFWIRITLWTKKKVDIITQKGFAEKISPIFNKTTIINLRKIFEYYSEISIKDIGRILTIQDFKKLSQWFQSLNKYPGITIDEYLVEVKIVQESVKEFIPEIIKNFEENFLFDL
ncbi:MAG: hypothetical protein HeimC3_10260 [Candidatus Heimdallarchaeota archaeon LC_3]|nr:MAG: hypothetical protein HeimC3_10260 [Candidatus Heimdallarchaeota archaeon LC_3]